MCATELYNQICSQFPNCPYPQYFARVWADTPLTIAKARLSEMRHSPNHCESEQTIELMAFIVAYLESQYLH